MMSSPKLCDDATLNDLVAALQSGAKDDIERTDRLIAEYPDDGRLHFLRASMLMEIGRSIEALPAFRKAVELAPDFVLARFQLGFFLLTSGDAAEALSVWGPLALLPADHYLRLFVGGLTHLIRDEFTDSVRLLREGITLNAENPPLNRDMALIIEQVEQLGPALASAGTDEDVSATSLLFGQFGPRRTH
jgi:tetratricopeptide (TPR) repeat protein